MKQKRLFRKRAFLRSILVNAMMKIDCKSWLLVKVLCVTCFLDGLVLNVGLTVEVKLRSQIPPAQCERDLS